VNFAKKKSLLMVGGSHADIPMINAAKELGFTVYTSGNRPDELGHRHGDGYHPADYSDPAQVLDVARKLDVDALCPSCNDFSALSCAHVAKELDLPGHDQPVAATVLHHKDKYRQFALANGIRTPKAVSFDSAPPELIDLEFPVIVKPVDLTGGK
jgi:phosphoribosylaminoimidazole carboxylase (NCAIR synthetase)